MNVLAPSALAFAVLAIPLIGLYMLRARRHRHEVPSTMLWDGEEDSISAARPWQRLPFSWPLLLQLLILALFVTALARPFTTEVAELGPHTVFVIDTSGSMAMAGRLDQAKEDAIGIIGGASATNIVSVVAAGATPDVIVSFSADPDEAIAAVSQLEAGGGVEDLPAAVRAARALATPDRPTSVLIFSDGGSPDRPVFDEPIQDARHFIYDQIEDNVALSSIALDVIPGEGVRLFVEVLNATLGPRDIEGVVSVDGVVRRTFRAPAEAGGRGRDSVLLNADAGAVIEISLINEAGEPLEDGIETDNHAVAVVPSSPELDVQVQGESSLFLNALFTATPGVRVTEDAEIVVADRVTPAAVDRPMWLIRPPVPPEGLTLTGVVQNVAVTFQRPGEPILDAVDLSEVVVGEAQIVDGPGWVPIVSARDVPLILLGEVGGVRTVYTTFDLTHSNLPVQVGFPVIGSRILRWLAGDDIGGAAVAEAGTPVVLVGSSTETPIVIRPDGSRVELRPGSLAYENTEAPGLYAVEYRSDSGDVRTAALEVRSFAAVESTGDSQELSVVAPSEASGTAGSVIRELARPLLIMLALMFAIEWLATHRRPPPTAPRERERELIGVGRR